MFSILNNMSKTMIIMGILIFIGGLIGMFIYRSFSKKFMIFMGAIYLSAGVGAFFLVEHYYEMPKNDVEIILNDFDGQAESVFLSQVLIDGEEYHLEHMKSGNWVWQNNSYGWKNVSGTVLEDIDTDVIAEIPIGYVRMLNFNVNGDGVKVRVRENDDTTEQILFRGDNLVQLKETSKKQIYLAKFFKIAVFTILFVVFIIIIQLIKRYWESVSAFCSKNGFYLIILNISFLSFLFMWRHAGDESFWYDEVYTLGFLQGTEKTNSMWIVSGIMRAWTSIAPYGQKYLLLPEIFAVACSVYFVGLLGKRICNEQCGIIVSVLLGFSRFVWQFSAFEYRSYAFVVLFSAITLYLLLVRNAVIQYKWIFSILYGVSLLLLMDSHEYGKVLTACYLILDMVLMIGKKIKIRYLSAWILPFLYGIYWLVNNDLGHLWNNHSNRSPTIDTVVNTFMLLCNQQWFFVGLVLCSIIYVIKLFIDYLKDIKAFSEVDKYCYPLYLTVGVFACSIIYSTYINPKNSLYYDRYFSSVITYIYIMLAVVIGKVIDYIMKLDKKHLDKYMVSIGVACLLIFNGWQTYREAPLIHGSVYGGTAEWLKNQEDIYDKDVMIVSFEGMYIAKGWLYFFNQGKDEHLPQITYDLNCLHDMQYKKVYLISYIPGLQEFPEEIDGYKSVMDKAEYGIRVYEKKEL